MSGQPSAKMNVVIRPRSGGQYDTWIVAVPRGDGRWDGALEFRTGDNDAIPLRTAAQTTQTSVDAVFRWGTGLSVTHIEDAFANVANPTERGPAGRGTPATPPTPDERLRHLQPVERDIMHAFAQRKKRRIETVEFFRRGPYANADFVRAFEDLEKRHRLLIRHTVQGADFVELTQDGADLLGIAP